MKGKNESSSTIMPLYEEIKRIIYDDFQEIKIYGSKIRISQSKGEQRALLMHFKKSFLNFYTEVNDKNKIGKLEKDSELLKRYYKNPKLILTQEDIRLIVDNCRNLMDLLGITKIEYTKDLRPGMVRDYN